MSEQNNFVKITSVLYGLLDFLPDEVLKVKMKERALMILNGLTVIFKGGGWVSVGEHVNVERRRVVLETLEHLAVLENYLELARMNKWFLDMNYLIIVKEYQLIKAELLKQISIKNVPIPVISPLEKKSKENYNSDVKKEKEVIVKESKFPPLVTPIIQKIEKNNSTRQEKIIEILTANQKAQVADLIKQIPKVTKRTLRRDLDGLLKQKKIKRVGQFNQVFYEVYS